MTTHDVKTHRHFQNTVHMKRVSTDNAQHNDSALYH